MLGRFFNIILPRDITDITTAPERLQRRFTKRLPGSGCKNLVCVR